LAKFNWPKFFVLETGVGKAWRMFRANVHNHTSHDPVLSCYHDPKLNVTVLYQIRICLTKNGTSLTNCLNPDSSCGDQSLLFPKKEEEK